MCRVTAVTNFKICNRKTNHRIDIKILFISVFSSTSKEQPRVNLVVLFTSRANHVLHTTLLPSSCTTLGVGSFGNGKAVYAEHTEKYLNIFYRGGALS